MCYLPVSKISFLYFVQYPTGIVQKILYFTVIVVIIAFYLA